MMKKSFLLILALACTCLLTAQKFVPEKAALEHRLGDDLVRIGLYQYGNKKDIVFINLHSDESTSVEAANKILQEKGGLLIKVENGNKRNITFQLEGRFYAFDPNRIFSKIGIQHTLERFKNIDEQAIKEVEKFANSILKLLPEELHCVIALHNNTEGGLAINSYLPGNRYEKDAQKVYANPQEDPDDFFLTTDSLLFEQLAREKYNIVWQDNLLVQQDGSLSVYCGEKNIFYLNCETQDDKVRQHEKMLRSALYYIEERK